ncbi:SecY-interacting protein [Alteromonas sp. CYL-A6]|uniref:SecY-interacting protein n=1 Tax=Alteromonas nitratireducens TaxID=3390813 RepID=UPI0034A8831B
MTTILTHQLDNFVNNTLALYDRSKKDMLVEYDPDWPSPCYRREGAAGEQVLWRPSPQNGKNQFANVESALGITLNDQFCEFFTRYYSNNLAATASEGDCELLQVWNDEDFARLQENLIGHVLMKRRLKQVPTLFFAVTDEDDYILSVRNDTGEVVLEPVGKPPTKVIADDLASFLASLTPRIS